MSEENLCKYDAERKETEGVEETFQEFLRQLDGDESLEQYRNEFENLITALKKSQESENRLLTKSRELKAKIISNSVKLDTSLKLTEDDESLASVLQKEINEAWQKANGAKDAVISTKETIETLQNDIATLTDLLTQGTLGPKINLNDLLKTKDELSQERDELLTEVVVVRENLTKASSDQQEMEAQQENAVETIAKMQRDIQACHEECSRETLRKEKAEKELEQLHEAEDAKHMEIKALKEKCEGIKEEQQRLQEKLKEDGVVTESITKELEDMQAKNTKLRLENEQTSQIVEQLSLENQQRTSELKTFEAEAEDVRQEISKLELQRENNQKKLHRMEDQKVDVEQQRDTLKNQIVALEREVESNQRQMKIDKKAIKELMREKDIVNKNLIKAASAAKKQLNVVKLHEQSKKNLELEIKHYKDEARKQQKIISQLEKERDRYINETNSIMEEVHQIVEKTRERELEIFDYRKKIADVENEVKHQQHLYEAVRCDKTIYSKHLNEIQLELSEMKTELKMMQCDADQLKEELHGKGCAFEKETLEFLAVEDENEQLKVELHDTKEKAQETKHVIETQEAEESRLLKIIDDTDAERLRQKKQLNQVIRERDILGRLLVERNKKVEQLYKRMKIQQYVMNKGEMQYNQMVESIHLTKMEIRKLAQEKNVLAKKVSNIEDLRREVNYIEKELLKEQMMCKALEEDIQILKNVHRWRKLKICDLGTYKLIQKIHFLQKCLIAKTKELEETEMLLQRRQKSCIELKHVLARQPGPEVAEQLKIFRQTMRQKKRQLKELRSDVSKCQSQKNESKNKIEILNHELKNVKSKYIAKKRKQLQSSSVCLDRDTGPSSRNVISGQGPSPVQQTNVSSSSVNQRKDLPSSLEELSAGCLRSSACPRTSER